MSFNLQTSVKALGFSNRTTNALVKNGINTAQELLIWLDALSEDKNYTLDGIGASGLKEINDFLERVQDCEEGNEYFYNNFGSYWRSIQRDDRNFDILVEYYNCGSEASYQEIGEKNQISRARVQQIVAMGTKRLQEAFNGGLFGEELEDILDEYANNRTELHSINIEDEYFTVVGIIYLVSSFEGSKYQVYTNKNLNGEWFIMSDDRLGKLLGVLMDELRHRSEPLLVSEIERIYSINDDMLMSIKGIIEKDGYVTHENNKFVTGTDRHTIVTDYLESVNRPVSISEIANNTILSVNQVRGALCDKRIYINVGKSVYDLAERDYKDSSIVDLIIGILTAEDRALSTETVFKYIRRYKSLSEQDFSLILLDAPGIQKHDDYLLLDGWGLDKIKKASRGEYYIKLEDAVLDIINRSEELFDFEKISEELNKYDGKVSTNPNSIKATLVRLAEKNLITRVGGARTGCYMKNKNLTTSGSVPDPSKLRERVTLGTFINANIGKNIEIRYKTKRVKSDKRWRVISVRGQDARYIYTNDLNSYGYRIKYLKERVVEYRESSESVLQPEIKVKKYSSATYTREPRRASDWYQDVCDCVDKLDDVFSLEEIYKFEKELQRLHPLNNNVCAKIRQQLQVMIENGRINRITPGIYRKETNCNVDTETTDKTDNVD